MSARTVAVVLAGGVGVRVGLGMPKQLIRIAGKAIVEHTLERLEASPVIDEVLVMMNAASIRELDHLMDDPRFTKLSAVLPGGETRNDSTKLALAALADDESTKVLFHDAVRPFLDDRIIEECVRALDEYDAVDTAIPSADTIIEVAPDATIAGIPPRATLRRGQTPQGFRLGVIRRAYELADGDPEFSATDDCGVVFTYLPEVKIKVIAGTAENMKVTEPLDIHIADKIFQLAVGRTDSGLVDPAAADTLRGRSVVVFGGSYGIGASIARQAEAAGARVHAFSRSETGTDVTSRSHDPAAHSSAPPPHGGIDHVVITAGVLSISELVRTPKKLLRATLETNLLAPAMIAQEAHAHLAARAASCCSSPRVRTRAAAPATACTRPPRPAW